MTTDTTSQSILIGGNFEISNYIEVPLYQYQYGRLREHFRYNRLNLPPDQNYSQITGMLAYGNKIFLTLYRGLYTKDTIVHSRGLVYWQNDSVYPYLDTSFYKPAGSPPSAKAPAIYQNQIVFQYSILPPLMPMGPVTYSKNTNELKSIGNGIRTMNINVKILSMMKYQGKLYAGGHFSNGTFGNDRNLQAYDGANWSGIKGWQFPSFVLGDITSMAVYKGDLYIGGLFRKREGGIADHIVRYDGTHFYDIKSGFDTPRHAGIVSNMKVHKGYLYVYGSFVQTYHEWPTNGIVRWDGSRWCRARGEFNGNISDIAFLNDTLFVGGGFTLDNGNPLKYGPSNKQYQ